MLLLLKILIFYWMQKYSANNFWLSWVSRVIEGQLSAGVSGIKFVAVGLLYKTRGSQRHVVYLGWPRASSYISPNGGGGGVAGSRSMNSAVHHCTWSPKKLLRSNSTLKVLIYFIQQSVVTNVHLEDAPFKRLLNSPKSNGRPPSCSWEQTDQWLQSLWSNSEKK